MNSWQFWWSSSIRLFGFPRNICTSQLSIGYDALMVNENKFHVQRHAEREVHERLDIEKLLDGQYVCHVGFIDPDINSPFVIPMGFARDGDRILIHGSSGSRIMMAIAQGIDLCVTVTQLNAIVVARSAFNSSMNYESVMIFGKARALNESEKEIALERITTKLVPGLWEYGRPIMKKESAATLIVELSLDKVSAKARSGEPSDDEEDIALPLWAGLLPLTTSLGSPITATNAVGIPVPPHIG